MNQLIYTVLPDGKMWAWWGDMAILALAGLAAGCIIWGIIGLPETLVGNPRKGPLKPPPPAPRRLR